MKVIGLGVACIILVAALFGTVFFYNNYVGSHAYSNDQYNSLMATYNQLNSSYQSLLSDLNQTTEMLAEKDIALSKLQNDYSNLAIWIGALLSPPADHAAIAALVNASYPNHVLTNKFLFSSAVEDGTESDWALLWIDGNVIDAGAFMSIIVTNSNLTSIEFSRCDLTGGDLLSVNITGTITGQSGQLAGFYPDIFNSTDALKGYIDLQGG